MSSQPAAMTKAARAEPTPLAGKLPDEIVIWEILVCLPRKTLLRCRAVCRTWRRITSTLDFLLAHHGHQPSLPLFSRHEYGVSSHQDIVVFDHRAATTAAQIQPVARLNNANLHVDASCDGLLVMSTADNYFSVCNPTTRQWGDLPILCGFHFSGIYPHRPTGQYRLLLYRSKDRKLRYEGMVPGDEDSWYVLSLGCDKVPRCIGWPEVALRGTPVLLRGSLHWYPAEHESTRKMILAFNTIGESFRLMPAPESADRFETQDIYLFEMDDMLGMSMHNDDVTAVDIWVMHDYESEVWTLKCRVELPVAKISRQFERLVVASEDGSVFVLVHFEQLLLRIDIEGKLVASIRHDGQRLLTSSHRLKQSLVQHKFFSALHDYEVNASPFI